MAAAQAPASDDWRNSDPVPLEGENAPPSPPLPQGQGDFALGAPEPVFTKKNTHVTYKSAKGESTKPTEPSMGSQAWVAQAASPEEAAAAQAPEAAAPEEKPPVSMMEAMTSPDQKKAPQWFKGFANEAGKFATFIAQAAGASGAGLSMEADPAHAQEAMENLGKWESQVIDPMVRERAAYELGPNASRADKVSYGLGGMAALLGETIVTGGGALAERITASLLPKLVGSRGASLAARAGARVIAGGAGGAAGMTVPNAAEAASVGRDVYEETGDANAAVSAAVKSYLRSSVMAAAPYSVPGRLVTRMAAAGTVGAAVTAGGQLAEGQTPSASDALDAFLTTAPLGILGSRGEPIIHETQHSVIDAAEAAQAARVAAQGGDPLDQVVAMTQAHAEVGGVYHAAEVHQTRAEIRNAQMAEEAANEQAQAKVQAATAPEGGLPPEEAPETFAGRRQAAVAAEQETPFQPQTLAERRSANEAAKTREETDFEKLPEQPTENQAPTEAQEPTSEGEAPEGNPPPQTAATLAQRRQQALDEAMAAKVRGVGQEAPSKAANAVPTPSDASLAKAATPEPDFMDTLAEQQAKKDAEAAAANPEGPRPPLVQAGAQAKPNRLAAIRAAAEKRALAARAAPPPEALENNGSGESAASEEAIHRLEQEKEAGIQRWSVDADGNRTPLTGVDAVDAKAPPGGVTYMTEPKKPPQILDRGGKNRLEANGLVQRAEAKVAGAQFDDEGVAADIRKQMRMPVEEANEHLDKLNLPEEQRAKLTVADNIQHPDVPDYIRQEAIDRNHPNPRGVYDPKSGRSFLFSEGHDAGNMDDLHDTAIHELLHDGMRNTFGLEWVDGMSKVAKEAPSAAKAWMRDYAEQHGLDMKNDRHRALVADEYAVHSFLDPKLTTPTLRNKIVDLVRRALAKLGIGRYMSDEDIRNMVARANSGLKDVRPDIGEREANGPLRWADRQEDETQGLPPSDPAARAAKFGRTMEEQARSGPGALRSRLDFAKGALTNANVNTMKGRLGFLHMDSLPDIVRAMQTPREFIQTTQQMFGRNGRLMEEGNQIALKWSRWANGGIFKDPQTGKLTMKKGFTDGESNLATIMHGATLAGVHPDRAYEPEYSGATTPDQRQSENLRRAVHSQLQDMYNNKLDTEGRQIYQQVKQFHEDRRADVMRALEARISETGADEKTKASAMAQLRQTFEAGRVKGPYFPLARFGDHWARAVDPDTEQHFFSRFEDVMQRKRWIANAKAAGLNVEQGTKVSDKSLMERIDPDFVKSIMSATEGHADLQDEIWQQYLKAMPEMSMRKNLIHRKGILGYTENALRGFAYNAFHSAHQIARLEYGNRLDSLTNRMGEEADKISNDQPDTQNGLWAPQVAAEFKRRLDWIKNPRGSAAASSLTKLGFGWYIGASPATAIRISTQNAMLAEPYLAARAAKWGLGYWGAARGELWKAVGQWAAAKGNLGDKLRGNEREMFDELRARGTFSSTAAQTLASGGNDRPIGVGPLDAFNRTASFLFNAMEHKNRQTTALAAYRLAIRGGLPHADAIEEANEASNKAHFNYSNYNRPRVLQNDFMKVIGLFKQYPWQVTDRLARSFRDGVLRNSELSDADKNEQLKAFAGYMGKMMLFAGVAGVPLYHSTMAAINGVFGDKNKPFDAEAALREHLEQSYGKTASDAIMDGPMSALTGAALSNGASYADLWYKTPGQDLSATQQWNDILQQAAGPVAALPLGAVQAADIYHQTGNAERALEHFAPPGVNHLMKANRLAQEGATNLRGESVVSPEELGQGWSTPLVGVAAVRAKNLMLQALGFSPEVVARQYAQNASASRFDKAIHDRQHELTQRYDAAVGRGDNADAIHWMGEMQKFHRENPGLPWSATGMVNSLRTQAMQKATARHGVNMGRLGGEYDQMTGAKPPGGQQ